MLQMGMVGCVCISDSAWVCLWYLRCGEHVGVSVSVCLWVAEHMSVADVRSRFCCMESDRYRLTVLFLKTFFRSWALSVKLQGRTQRKKQWDTDIIMRIMGVSFLFPQKSDRIKDKLPAGQMCLQWEVEETERDRSRESSQKDRLHLEVIPADPLFLLVRLYYEFTRNGSHLFPCTTAPGSLDSASNSCTSSTRVLKHNLFILRKINIKSQNCEKEKTKI